MINPNQFEDGLRRGRCRCLHIRHRTRLVNFLAIMFLPCVLSACLYLAASAIVVATLSCSNLFVFIIFQVFCRKSISMKSNRTGVIQSPCLTPTFWLVVSSISPILRTTFRSWYILVMEERSFGGGDHTSSKSGSLECDQRYQTPWQGPQTRRKWVSCDCVLCGVVFSWWTFHLGIQLQVRIRTDI